MQLLKSRWPFALVFLGAFGYLSQYYRIDGLQNLKLKPLTRAARTAQSPSDFSARANPFPPSDLAATNLPGSSLPATGVIGNGPLVTTHRSDIPLGTSLAPLPPVESDNQFASTSNVGPIHVGSFHMRLLNNPIDEASKAWETAAVVCARFDVLAIQGILTKQQDALPQFIAAMNRSGRSFDYVIGPRVGPTGSTEQFAFVYDTARIETDRDQLYTVDDPQDLLQYEPLVAWFRVKGVPVESAFTFTLVSLRSDEVKSNEESALIPELARTILADGRQEDDIIFAGVFNASARQMDFLKTAGLHLAFENSPTTVRGDRMLDNIVFPATATIEYMGRSGVMDILREFNLSIGESEEISSHLPLWAEFNAVEGNQAGRIAPIQ
jgi:deoxyribonuclease-1-like protein